MIAAEDTACILLAAGQSRRFKPGHKLLEPFRGAPLASYAANTLASLPFKVHAAVTSQATNELFRPPFLTYINATPESGIAGSITIGVKAVMPTAPRAILIALADMPLVPLAHFEALLGAFDVTQNGQAIASICGGRVQVPALFPVEAAQELKGLQGDNGAKAILKSAKSVSCDPLWLMDFDTAADFAKLK